jgi:exportin-5
MMSYLGNFIEQKISVIPEDCDLPNLLDLFLTIAKSQSFVVSIPVLVTWTRLLRSDTISGSLTINPLIAPLLELCSSRLIRYEHIPGDSEDASLMFLHEDIDTVPERHAFLGNYRRYSVQIIELIVRQKQSEAIYHILTQVDHSMQHLYDGQPPFAGWSFQVQAQLSKLTISSRNIFKELHADLKGRRSIYGS